MLRHVQGKAPAALPTELRIGGRNNSSQSVLSRYLADFSLHNVEVASKRRAIGHRVLLKTAQAMSQRQKQIPRIHKSFLYLLFVFILVGEDVWKVKIIDREEHWRIRYLKESAYMLGYSELLSRLSIEMNTIWESIIKNVWWKKMNHNMSSGKKIIYNRSKHSDVRTLSL